MKTELLKSEEAKQKEPRKLEVDWTKSEWFAVWLRLARGEYEPKPEPVAVH